ncbi:unnamed protein product [Caenorhabditis brenneri]
MATPRAQWKISLVEKAMQFPSLENVLKHNRSSDFEKWQRILLFAAFKKYPSLSDERWAELTAEVELTKDQVLNWFYGRKSDDAKKKMEEVVSTVNFREFQLKGPPPTEKEKKEVAAKHAKIKNRVQFVFNPSQVEILNEFFKKNATPIKKDMVDLREKLGDVEHKQIKQWFANKRKRSKEYQEHYHQGQSVDKNPTQRHSCSAFPVGVRNILLEEFEKCSNVNEKNMERIMKDTGMNKTQVQSWFWNERQRRERASTVKNKATTSTTSKKSAEKTKKIQVTIEYQKDKDGNVSIKIPANLFESVTQFTIQRQDKTSQSKALHKNAKRSKVQVISEDVDSDDEDANHSASSSVVKKPIGVSKQKNGKTEKPEKSLPSTTHVYPTRKRAHVPSDTEETDDEKEDKPAPVFRKWNEVSKKPNEKSEKSPEKVTDTTSENEETDDEEESGSQHNYPTRSKRQATSETPKLKIVERKDRKTASTSNRADKKSPRVSTRNVYPTRSKANVTSEVPEELDISDVASPNSSSRTIRRSRRNQRAKTPDQSETGHFDEFDFPSPAPSRSPAPQRQEREDSNTPSEGIAMAPEPMDLDFDDFNHQTVLPPLSPKPQKTEREGTAPAEMDLDDSSRETTPAPSPELAAAAAAAAETEQAPQPPTEEAPPTVAPKAKVEEKKKNDCEAGGSGIDWEGERLARREARRRLRQIVSTPDESDLSESSRSSTPLSGISEVFPLEDVEAIQAKLNSNESFSTEQSSDEDDDSKSQGRSSDEEMEDGSDEEMEDGSDGEMEDGSDGEVEDGSDGEVEDMEQVENEDEDREEDDEPEDVRIERQVNEYLEKNARAYENSFRNFSHK